MKEAHAIVVPAPPEVTGERPETLLRGCDEAVEGAGRADDGRDLVGRFDEHSDLCFGEDARLFGLHDEDALQDAAVNEGYAEKGVVGLFAGLLEVFEARMVCRVFDSDGLYLFGDESGESLIEREAECADAPWVETQGRSEDQVRTIWFEQVGRADVCLEARRDEGDYVHEGVDRFAALFSEVGEFFEGQNVAGVKFFVRLAHRHGLTFRSVA